MEKMKEETQVRDTFQTHSEESQSSLVFQNVVARKSYILLTERTFTTYPFCVHNNYRFYHQRSYSLFILVVCILSNASVICMILRNTVGK